MRTHKNNKFIVALTLLIAALFSFSSCEKDKDPDLSAPVIDLAEVGSGNSKTATIGDDLHLEGTITAEALIHRIDIEIHQEGGGSFEIKKSYIDGKYIGVKEAEFHEHLDIPANAPAGEYHLHFTVTDKNGKTTTVESEILLEKAFDALDYFVAGTLTQQSGSKYTSVFFIQFLEDGKALFINSAANNLVGTYTVSDDELVFEVEGGNARIAKFTLDANKKITSAYYKALTMEYDATGELLPVTDASQLAGKTFKGEEFKMGQESFRQGLIYSFNAKSPTYGSGTDQAAINNTASTYIAIGGSGFKFTSTGKTELGFVSGNKLTVFRSEGLYYYGKYDQQ